MKKILPLLALLALAAMPAWAVDYFWTNSAADNDFTNWANWTPAPTTWTGNHNWVVDKIGADKAQLLAGQSVALERNVYVGDTFGESGEFLMAGGTLDISRNLRVGRNQSTGAFNMSGGTITAGYGLFVGQTNSVGALTISGGTVTVSSVTTDGLNVAHQAGGNGTLLISGDGVLTVVTGRAVFSDGAEAVSVLSVTDNGALNVDSSFLRFGDKDLTTSTVTIAGSGSVKVAAGSVAFGFGNGSVATLDMSGGELDAPASFMTFSQGGGSNVTVTLSGGTINSDRMSFANFGDDPGDPTADPPIPPRPRAVATLDMTGGTINVVRSGASEATVTGAFRMGPGDSHLSASGNAVINTEKFWFADGGVLTLSGDAAIHAAGSTDGINPTFDFSEVEITDGLVLGRLVVNGGSFSVQGAADPVSAVNYAELLSSAIAAGIITTEVEGAELLAQYDAGSDLTRLVLSLEPVPVVSPWEDLPEIQGFKMAGIGWIRDAHYPHLFHFPAGWLMIVAEGATLDGFYGYDFAGGNWFWSRDSLGGWHYNFAAAAWQTW